jgi:hypothetical protein
VTTLQIKNQKFKNFVFGNSLASIVAASQLRKTGIDFLWIQDGSKVEGIWRGIEHKNRILDLGMINFEIDVHHPNPSFDLSTYSQYSVNDCAKFTHCVLEFISQHTEIKKLPKILILEKNHLYKDHLISNDFSELNRFSSFASETLATPTKDHPSKKYTFEGKEILLNVSYDEYVKKYFGVNTSQSLFLNWAEKLIGQNVTLTNTYRHRAAWLPLPYPETIQAALTGNQECDLSYNFHYPSDVTFSEFVNQIANDLNNNSEIQKIDLSELKDNEIEKVLGSGHNVFWGAKLELFQQMTKNNDFYDLKKFRNLINIEIFEVELENDFENYVILNNDINDGNWYRLTLLPNVVLQNGCQIAVIETRNSNIDFKDSEHFLEIGIKLVSHVKCITGVPVFLTLDGNHYREYESWHQTFVNSYVNIDFGGNSSFAYSATFSDQIIQGMRFARKVLENDAQ